MMKGYLGLLNSAHHIKETSEPKYLAVIMAARVAWGHGRKHSERTLRFIIRSIL